MKTILILLMLLVPAVAWAAKCPPKCKHRTAAKCPTHAYSLWDQVVQGFELQAGFRWQSEEHLDCPTLEVPNPPPSPPAVEDPFYVGAGIRLPLDNHAGVFGQFDRDFTEAPKWQVRVGLFYAPWRSQ